MLPGLKEGFIVYKEVRSETSPVQGKTVQQNTNSKF